MLCGRNGTSLDGCGHEGAAGEVAGAPEPAAGTLVDRGHGIRSEERRGAAGDGDMMGKVIGHVIALEGRQVAT